MQAKKVGNMTHRSRSQAAVALLATNPTMPTKEIAKKVGMTAQTVSAAQRRELARLERVYFV